MQINSQTNTKQKQNKANPNFFVVKILETISTFIDFFQLIKTKKNMTLINSRKYSSPKPKSYIVLNVEP